MYNENECLNLTTTTTWVARNADYNRSNQSMLTVSSGIYSVGVLFV